MYIVHYTLSYPFFPFGTHCSVDDVDSLNEWKLKAKAESFVSILSVDNKIEFICQVMFMIIKSLKIISIITEPPKCCPLFLFLLLYRPTARSPIKYMRVHSFLKADIGHIATRKSSLLFSESN